MIPYHITLYTLLLFQIQHAAKAKRDLQRRGHWCRQTDIKQCRFRLAAHKPGYRNTDTESAQDSLDHHKLCQTDSIIETDIAEKDRRKHAVNGIGFQIICRRINNHGIR